MGGVEWRKQYQIAPRSSTASKILQRLVNQVFPVVQWVNRTQFQTLPFRIHSRFFPLPHPP